MEMNAFGTFNVSRLAAAAMGANEPDDEGQRGVIVNTASIAGIEGQTGQLAYAAAKAAILGMTLPMARDLSPLGIRVCAIAPGTMGTPLMMSTPEELQAHLVEHHPVPQAHGQARGVRPPRRVDRAQPVPQRRVHPPRRRPALPAQVAVVGVEDLVGALDLEPTGRTGTGPATSSPTATGSSSAASCSRSPSSPGWPATRASGPRPCTRSSPGGRRPTPRWTSRSRRCTPGRAFASTTVTISQGDRLCTRSLLLLTAEEPDLIRHADPAPAAAPPPTTAPTAAGEWEVRVVDDVDISDPELTGPPDLDVWTRFPGAPDDPTTDQALLAFATDGFLIGTAMRPHAGVGQSQAHVTLTTGVISHTLTFHEPFVGAGLAAARPTTARTPVGGRSYGRADVFRADGALVASYVQDAMIRAKDPDRGGACETAGT